MHRRNIKSAYCDKAICLNFVSQVRRCRYIWMAILPNGLTKNTALECPKCKTMTGVFVKWWVNNKHKPAVNRFWVKGYSWGQSTKGKS